jgi:hypothetical protein
VRQSHFQLYGLKLIKSLVPFEDQEWRVVHKDLISRVYFTVRFDMLDHWLSTMASESGMLDHALHGYRELKVACSSYNAPRSVPMSLVLGGGEVSLGEVCMFLVRELGRLQ